MAKRNSDMDGQEVQEVVINGTRDGLGIRIVGGMNVASSDESEFGIFVKEVIKNSLAARDGHIRRGDQLIEANGTNLIGVSNERAVSILQACAKTNSIKLLISRSAQSQQEFRRLSNSLLLQPLASTQSKQGAPQLTTPVATSTPRSTESQGAAQQATAGVRVSAVSEGTAATNTRPSSASSNLTQVSTTDIETDDDIDKPFVPREERTRGRVVSPASTEVALSDVVLTMDHARTDSGGSPPPIPVSAPPMSDDESLGQRDRFHSGSSDSDTAYRVRTTPEGKVMSPPLSATLAQPSHTTTHTFIITKNNGLGIVISGGINRQDGPHIFIDKILHGMDAARDGQLKKGDRILSVNGIMFSNMTREKALTTLTQLKIRSQVKAFTIAVERAVGDERDQFLSGPLPSLPQPTRSITSSIFESDTLRASQIRAPDSVTSTPSAPDVYYQREADQARSLSHRRTEVKREDSAKKSTPQRYKKDGGTYDSLHKRLSMEPSARVKLTKLEWALNYMGYIITHQQQKQIRASLDISEDGRVVFAEFVNLAKELFAFKLDDAHLEANLVYALTQKDGLDMPVLPRKATSVDQLAMEYSPDSSPLKLASSQPLLMNPSPSSTTQQLDQMRQQLHEIGGRRDKLKLSDTSGVSELNRQRAYEKETSQSQQNITVLPKKPTVHESQETSSVSISEEASAVLKKKAGLAEAAAKASREKANQMEDTIRQMQAELSVLREQHRDHSAQDMRTHLAAMDCELRKEKATTRRYQVATEHLLQFVENCHEALVKSPEADKIMYHPHGQGQSVVRGDAVTGNPRPPQYLSRHAKVTATTLAQEAKETISAVQKLLQAETLPVGWDFAYTEDGKKYYVNHETKTTSWVHPVTKVNASHGTRASTPSSQGSYRSNPP